MAYPMSNGGTVLKTFRPLKDTGVPKKVLKTFRPLEPNPVAEQEADKEEVSDRDIFGDVFADITRRTLMGDWTAPGGKSAVEQRLEREYAEAGQSVPEQMGFGTMAGKSVVSAIDPVQEGVKRLVAGARAMATPGPGSTLARAIVDPEVRRGIADVGLGGAQTAISAIPQVAAATAVGSVASDVMGEFGENVAGDQGRAAGETLGHYLSVAPFGWKVLAGIATSDVSGRGMQKLMESDWAKGNIPDQDRMRIVEGTGHAGFFLGLGAASALAKRRLAGRQEKAPTVEPTAKTEQDAGKVSLQEQTKDLPVVEELKPYERMAEEGGVIFNGVQKTSRGADMPLFTDPITKTTFTLNEGESVRDALVRKRRLFHLDDEGRPLKSVAELAQERKAREELGSVRVKEEAIQEARVQDAQLQRQAEEIKKQQAFEATTLEDLYTLRDKINEQGRYSGRSEDITFAQQVAKKYGVELKAGPAYNQFSVYDAQGKRISRPKGELTPSTRVEDAKMLESLTEDQHRNVMKILDEVGDAIDVPDMTRANVAAAIKDIREGGGKEASLRAQTVLETVLRGLDEGTVGVVQRAAGAEAKKTGVPVEELLRAREEAPTVDALKQQLVNIAATGEGVSAEGILKARELADKSKDLFTTEQRGEISGFLETLQGELKTYESLKALKAGFDAVSPDVMAGFRAKMAQKKEGAAAGGEKVRVNEHGNLVDEGGNVLFSAAGVVAGIDTDDDGNLTFDPVRGLLGAATGIALAGILGRYKMATARLGVDQKMREVFTPLMERTALSMESLVRSGKLHKNVAGKFAESRLMEFLEKHPDYVQTDLITQKEWRDAARDVAQNMGATVRMGEGVTVDNLLKEWQRNTMGRILRGEMKKGMAAEDVRRQMVEFIESPEGAALPREDAAYLQRTVRKFTWSKKVRDEARIPQAENKAITIAMELEPKLEGFDKAVAEMGWVTKGLYNQIRPDVIRRLERDPEFTHLDAKERKQVLKTVDDFYRDRVDRSVEQAADMSMGVGPGPEGLKGKDFFEKTVNRFDLYRDIGNVAKGLRDIDRNFEVVFKNDYPLAKKLFLDPLFQSKGKFVETQERYLRELQTEVVEKLGIKKGSKESAIVQDWGEGILKYKAPGGGGEVGIQTPADLVAVFGRKEADRIMAAERWFRRSYDNLLDRINETRKEIYPNNPTKLIPKRKDYFRHYKELSDGLGGLINVFETPAGIDPRLSGISPFTKPKSKWQSFAQRRLGIGTEKDAVGGFLEYLPNAAYSIHIDPNIMRFRGLADVLAETTKESKHLNNFIDYLRMYSNDLSGKTNDFDRIVTTFIPGGRKTVRALNWMNRRIKANVILGNAASAVAQIFNVPQGIASAKQYSVIGMQNVMMDALSGGKKMELSPFLKERYLGSSYGKFDTGMFNNTKKFAVWMTQVLDEVGTKFIWHSHYAKALAEKISDPIGYADSVTRRMVAGRGVGEVPLLQKSKVFQMVAPFQLEVQNLWWAVGDMVRHKDLVGLTVLPLVLYAMNKAAESIRGSGVAFDPIDAMVDAVHIYNDEDSPGKGLLKAGGRLGGEVLSNVVLGQQIASMLGNEAFRKKYFGKEDPTRFGTGGVISRTMVDIGGDVFRSIEDESVAPLGRAAGRVGTNLVTPFGGKQLEKTVRGGIAVKDGAVYDRKGKLLFRVDGTADQIRALIFGPYAPSTGREYFENQGKKRPGLKTFRPLKQLKTFKPLGQ